MGLDKRISVSTRRQEASAAPRELRNGEVLSVNFSVMLQRDIQAGDVLGFGMRAKQDGQIQHLPLLFNPGPTPGSFTPIIIANFTPTSNATQSKC